MAQERGTPPSSPEQAEESRASGSARTPPNKGRNVDEKGRVLPRTVPKARRKEYPMKEVKVEVEVLVEVPPERSQPSVPKPSAQEDSYTYEEVTKENAEEASANPAKSPEAGAGPSKTEGEGEKEGRKGKEGKRQEKGKSPKGKKGKGERPKEGKSPEGKEGERT